MIYVRFLLSLRNVDDLLAERGIDICHETVRFWWNRFGSLFAGDIRRQRVSRMRGFRHWRWHLNEMYVKLNGEMAWPGMVATLPDHRGRGVQGSLIAARLDRAALEKAAFITSETGWPATPDEAGFSSYRNQLRWGLTEAYVRQNFKLPS